MEFLIGLKGTNVSAPEKAQTFLNILIVAITVIVVAVPEGLPLAVTLPLAFATTRMLKDNKLVCLLRSYKTMGNATTICSDKTGTLTQSKISVVAGSLGTAVRFDDQNLKASDKTPIDYGAKGKSVESPVEGLDDVSATEFVNAINKDVKDLLEQSIIQTTTAFEDETGGPDPFIGSKTETALLAFARDHLGMGNVAQARSNANTVQVIPFDSAIKCSGAVAKLNDGRYRLYVNGASEILLGKTAKAMAKHFGILDRSFPKENGRLAKRLKELGETVAVTGNDTNDAPALKTADMIEPPVLSRLENPTEVFEIPSVIASRHMANVLGDLCAKKNFMKTAYAERLGLEINRGSIFTVSIGSGKQIKTSGMVETSFRFRDEPGIYSLVFHLIPDCIHDVILGKRFLKATQTFSSLANRARRVVKRIVHGLTPRDCLYLGDAAPRFTGLLKGQTQEALADSGCKILIMDECYARSVGLAIVNDAHHRIKLRFADGSTAMTSGMTCGVDWQFGPEKDSEKHPLDFYILRDAPAPVILNDTFLFQTNAFSEFDCYLVDEDDEDEEAYFFGINVDTNYYPQGAYRLLYYSDHPGPKH